MVKEKPKYPRVTDVGILYTDIHLSDIIRTPETYAPTFVLRERPVLNLNLQREFETKGKGYEL